MCLFQYPMAEEFCHPPGATLPNNLMWYTWWTVGPIRDWSILAIFSGQYSYTSQITNISAPRIANEIILVDFPDPILHKSWERSPAEKQALPLQVLKNSQRANRSECVYLKEPSLDISTTFPSHFLIIFSFAIKSFRFYLCQNLRNPVIDLLAKLALLEMYIFLNKL